MASNRRILTLLFSTLILLFAAFQTRAQRFYSVVFDQLPQDYQLYPRNEKNEAAVPVSGIIEVKGYSYLSVIVTRNNAPLTYLRAPISYDDKGIGRFATGTTIKAELADYTFAVYVCRSADSVLMVTRQKIVSGDAFVIMGQSNSTGFFAETETDEYCRTFGAITGTLNTEPYNPADTLWALSNQSGKANVGAMGLEIQKQLSQQSGIPNCLINGGFHWSSAYSHAIRNESNPADLNTAYGRMLYRVRKAGIAGVTRAFIFRQGETEAYGEGFDWENNFDKLYNHLKTDLPAIERVYVFQIDIIYHPILTGAVIRDYQRRLPRIYPDIRSLATVGTQEFDGLHYGRNGNIQSGFEVSRLLNRDFYHLEDTLGIDSPDINKVFYKTNERKELVLVFDEGQQLVYPDPYKPNGNVTLEMKDFFYLDDHEGAVSSGEADGNRVILGLKTPQTARLLSYLPPFLQEGGSYYPFNGPFIRNTSGMRAFTFYQVAITDALATPALTAAVQGPAVSLQWNKTEGTERYVLERKPASETEWTKIADLGNGTTSFHDLPPAESNTFHYRLKAVNATSESGDYGYADARIALVTGTEKTGAGITVYPNPAKSRGIITIGLGKPMSGILRAFDKNGRKTGEFPYPDPTAIIRVDPGRLSPDTYLLQFDSGDRHFVKRILIVGE